MLFTDWQDLLDVAEGCRARPAVAEREIAEHEKRLGLRFRAEVKELYLVSDGVFDTSGNWFVLWPMSRLADQNELEWARGVPTRHELLAIGDDGLGGRFCVPRNGDGSVFLWEPREARPVWLANDLTDFWTAWRTGSITTYAEAE